MAEGRWTVSMFLDKFERDALGELAEREGVYPAEVVVRALEEMLREAERGEFAESVPRSGLPREATKVFHLTDELKEGVKGLAKAHRASVKDLITLAVNRHLGRHFGEGGKVRVGLEVELSVARRAAALAQAPSSGFASAQAVFEAVVGVAAGPPSAPAVLERTHRPAALRL